MFKSWKPGAVLRWLALVLLATSVCAFLRPQATPRYEVYAVRFAHVTYPTSSLVAGVPRGTTTDIAFTVWPIRAASGRVILFDAGFYRDQFLQRWHPSDYVKPSEAVASALGISPDDITDLVISHVHWDHADGADLFPRATIWIQKDEYEYYVSPDGTPLHNGRGGGRGHARITQGGWSGEIHRWR